MNQQRYEKRFVTIEKALFSPTPTAYLSITFLYLFLCGCFLGFNYLLIFI